MPSANMPAAGTNSFAALVKATFGFGTPGSVLVVLMMIAVVTWGAKYIASTVGSGRIAAMIETSSLFVAILSTLYVAILAIKKVLSLAGY